MKLLCPQCKDSSKMIDVQVDPHVIISQKVYHPNCGMEAIKAGKVR